MQASNHLHELEIPVDAESLQATPKWVVSDAEKEERKWDELEEIRRKNDSLWLKIYGWIVCILMGLFALIFAVVFLLWTWHHVAPINWLWLDEIRLNKIQSVLFSGGMGAIVSSMLKKQLYKA